MSDFHAIPGPAWIGPFLNLLASGSSVRAATRCVKRTWGTVYNQRKRNAAFAAAWLRCRPRTVGSHALAELPAGALVSATGSGQKHFLEVLAETSNVAVAAARANMSLANVYKLRRKNAAFAAGWRAALVEGYDLLEMELLGHLRDPAATRKMDVTSALRLLAAHRDTVARERALREDDDEDAVLESIDRFIDEMRQRRRANAALLIERRTAGNPHGDESDAAG